MGRRYGREADARMARGKDEQSRAGQGRTEQTRDEVGEEKNRTLLGWIIPHRRTLTIQIVRSAVVCVCEW